MSLLQALSAHRGFAERVAGTLIRRRLARTVKRLEAAAEDARAGNTREEDPVELSGRQRPVLFDHSSLGSSLRAQILGPRQLWFCCLWSRRWNSLSLAEEQMLKTLSQRAGIEGGMEILSVSQNPTSLPQWMADKYPDCSIKELSPAQISGNLLKLGLLDRFDRILALEPVQLRPSFSTDIESLARYLRVGGRLFVQRPCHRKCIHPVSSGKKSRPRRYLPAADLVPRETAGLALVGHWEISGEHYERTARAWLGRLAENRGSATNKEPEELETATARRRYRELRFALLSTAEMYGLYRGQEWWVSQCLLERESTDLQQGHPTEGR
jgi:cyclopropane-fatty-acyl-phospholipid synthase